MCWIAVYNTVHIILFSDFVQILIFLLDFCWLNWVPLYQFLSVSLIVFREIHIDVTSDAMSVWSIPCNTILVHYFVYDLVVNADGYLRHLILRDTSSGYSIRLALPVCLSLCDSLLLILFCCLLLLLSFIFLKLKLSFSDLIEVLFPEV